MTTFVELANTAQPNWIWLTVFLTAVVLLVVLTAVGEYLDKKAIRLPRTLNLIGGWTIAISAIIFIGTLVVAGVDAAGRGDRAEARDVRIASQAGYTSIEPADDDLLTALDSNGETVSLFITEVEDDVYAVIEIPEDVARTP